MKKSPPSQHKSNTNNSVLSDEEAYRKEMAWRSFDLIGTIIITTDVAGNITLVNKRACVILGYEESELKGKPFTGMLASDEDRSYFSSFWLTGGKNRKKGMEVIRLGVLTRRGETRFIEFKIVFYTGKNMPDSLILSGKDVTDYLKVQSELQQSIYRHRMLASSIPGVNMYLFDRNLRFIIAEGSELYSLGIEPSNYEGKKLADVLDAKTRSSLMPLYDSALKGNEISTEYTYRDKEYMIWIYPMRNREEEVYGCMVVTQNITREKQNAERLSKAKKDAEEANRAKTEFLANISHEIRTPLNAIVGFAEQMNKTNLNKKQQKYVNIIEKSSEQLLALVNDLLILSKIEAGQIEFDENIFRIERVLSYIYQSMKPRANEKGIGFSFTVSEDLVVIGDEFRLSQILTNLVSNAIKFTETGAVKIICEKESENEDSILCRFEVHDTGVGIPKDKLDVIFDQFKQADSAVTKKFGGTGLGLTISKRLVEMKQGEIQVRSTPGKGTVFSVILPFRKGDSSELNRSDIDSGTIRFDGKRALVVDDDSVNRLLGQTILAELGFEVDLASSGAEAIQKLGIDTYDIIILDIHMPGVSGIDVADYVRQVKKDKNTKILAVTAAFLKEDVKSYALAGIDDYLIKPFRESRMYNKLCKMLGFAIPKKEEAEPVVKNSARSLYDLSELISMSGGDNEFIGSMLDTFIENVKDGIQRLQSNTDSKNWKRVGEVAHKILPSYRHLKVQSIVQDLEQLEKLTRNQHNTIKVPDIANRIVEQTEVLIDALNREKDKIRQ